MVVVQITSRAESGVNPLRDRNPKANEQLLAPNRASGVRDMDGQVV